MSWIALFVGVTVAYLLLAPHEVNGDGIGYLKAAQHGTLYPGHLLYVPLLRGVWHFASHIGWGTSLASGIWPGRALSAMSAALAAVLCGLCARRRTAALGLAASAGFIGAGCDIESYTPALAALLGCVYCLTKRRATLAGILLACAALLHIENALFVLPALILTTRRLRLLLAAAATGAMTIVALGFAPSSLLEATHGFHYPLHAYTPLVALWGALRTIVFAPYPYEASWPRVILPAIVAALFVVSLRLERPVERRPFWCWLVPYVLVGVLFFPSDPERWLFVLPLVWIAAPSTPRTRALVIALAILNVCLWLPRARDNHNVERARAAASKLRSGDLVLMPGHGWDESIALVGPASAEMFPLVFHAAARGGSAGLGDALDVAIGKSQRIVSVRLDGDTSPLGWKELVPFGLDRGAIEALLAQHHLRRAEELGDGVTRWTTRR